MIIKVFVFAIMTIGSLAAQGMIAPHLSSYHQLAFTLGQTPVSYGYCILGAMLAFSIWTAGKVKA